MHFLDVARCYSYGPRAKSFCCQTRVVFSCQSPLPYFRGLSFTAACQSLSSGSWGGNENKELRHRAPHCEGNVVSQPMHFNAGKLLGTPGGCAWGPGSTAFPSFCRPGINPIIPSWARKLQEPLHQQGSPPANQGATALMLKFHKHLLTQKRP